MMKTKVKKLSPTERMDIKIKDELKYFVWKIMALTNATFQNELDDILSDDFYKKICIAFSRDHGKAQSLDSKVLTPNGWKTIGELCIGDTLYGADGKECTVTHLHPISKMKLHRVTTRPGQSTLCNEEHLWRITTPRNKGEPKKVMSLKDFMNDYLNPRYDRRYPDRGIKMESFRWLECPQPVEFSYKNLPIDPYTLGVWLGDGTTANNSITIHDDDHEIIEKIPYPTKKTSAKYRWTIYGLRGILRGQNLLGNKHIPNKYLFSSIEQRIELLRGLMDTDGTCVASSAYFSNTNKNIIDGIVFLVRSLGGLATPSDKLTKLNGKIFHSWNVYIRLPFNPFYMKRKAKKYSFKRDYFRTPITDISFSHEGMGRCISVSSEDGMYITDDFMVTHNSTHLSVAYPLWEIARNHNLRILLVSSASKVSVSFMSQIINNIEANVRYQEWARNIDPNNKGVIPQLKGARKAMQKWSGDSIIIDREDLNLKDPTINGVGLFGSILSKRADIIIIDDLVNQVNSMTEMQREKVIDWFYTTVLPVLIPGGRCIYLGNTWHQDDLVSRMMRDPQFEYRKKRAAIIHESNNPELWEAWRDILLDESIETKLRSKMAEDYYQANKVAMDDGVEVLWGERYTYKDLYLKRVANPYAFERMYQCDPSNRPNQKIRDEWIEEAIRKGAKYRLQKGPHEGITVAICCSGVDLAISEEVTADDTVLLTLDKVQYSVGDLKGGDFIIRNITRGKMSPNEVKNMIKSHVEEDKPAGVRVETVGYQQAIQRDLEDMSVPVTGYHTGGEKNDPDIGVNSLAILLEMGKLILPSDHTDPRTVKLISQLANEMRAYPEGHTGDALMALWFAYSEIRDRTANSVVIPSTYAKMEKSVDISTPELLKIEEKKVDIAMSLEQEHERANFRRMMGLH